MGVVAIWRYPVKAMLGELLRCVAVGAGGLAGDRRWLVVDAASGAAIANKRGPTDPRLRACRARIAAGGELVVTAPDGAATAVGPGAAAELLSELLDRRVELTEHGKGRGGYRDTAGHHDFAPVHVVTTSALERMRAIAPDSDWDARRFRPNLVLDDSATRPAPGSGRASEAPTALIGSELRSANGLRLSVGIPTPRCVVPTRATEELPADPAILKAVASAHRWDFGPLGRPACFGAYAEITAPGRLEAGERLAVVPVEEPEAAVAAVVRRVAGA